MKLSIPNAISTRAGRVALLTQKNSPRILFNAGIVLMGATVYSAAKNTLKLEGVLDDIKHDQDDVDAVAARHPGKYSEKELQKLHTYVAVRGAVRVVKLYLPALSLGVAAVACLTTSHNQLQRRNAGLSAALAATERALDKYRDRVRDAYGEEKELELWRGTTEEKQPVLTEDGEDTGKTKKVKVGGGYSPYARLWGRDTTGEWDPQPEYNLMKLRSVQERMTMILNSKGHLFLNEVHDELGLERTPAGQVVGWLAQKYGGNDGYVDFGILERGEEVRFLDFVTGREDHIMLDFNVDGEIWRKI